MTDTSDVMRDIVTLCAGWGDAVPSSLIFGQLAKRAAPVIDRYHSDLYHDALWIEAEIHGPDVFFWGVDECGTAMGRGSDRNPGFVLAARRTVYRVEVAHDDRDRWTMSFEAVS